jgi:hypothetical protein
MPKSCAYTLDANRILLYKLGQSSHGLLPKFRIYTILIHHYIMARMDLHSKIYDFFIQNIILLKKLF